MDVKEAVGLAKQYIRKVFAEEHPTDIGLEEVSFNDSTGTWYVTLGFSRPWDKPNKILIPLGGPGAYPKRSYKVVEISDLTKTVKSVKEHKGQS